MSISYNTYEARNTPPPNLEAGKRVPPPSIQISLEQDVNGNTTILPSKGSIESYAREYAKAPHSERIKLTGREIGSMDITPVGSPGNSMDMLDDPQFTSWVIKIMGYNTIAECPAVEMPVLREIYLSQSNILKQAQLNRKKGIQTGAIKNFQRAELDQFAEKIIGNDLGNPNAFVDSVRKIERVMYGQEGKEKEKDIPELRDEAIQYIFGQLIYSHILSRGRRIEVDGDTVKVITDNPNKVPIKDQVYTDGAWDKEIADNMRFGQEGIVGFTPNKIAQYIAAKTYHQGPVEYKNDDGLPTKKADLIRQVLGNNTSPITHDQIRQSQLSAAEKSFLLLWTKENETGVDVATDSELGEVSKQQTKYVEMADKNTRGKSLEQIKRDVGNKPVETMISILPLVAAPAILFYLSTKIKNGFFSGLFKILAGIFVIGGISSNAKAIDGFIRESGRMGTSGQSFTDNILSTAPKSPGLSLSERLDTIKTNWKKFEARMASGIADSGEGINILLNEKVGQNIATTYPVYSMLNNLNPAERTAPAGKYNAPDETGTKISDIETGFKNLKDSNPPEKAQLNTLLKNTWERYKKTDECKTNGWEKSKKMPLSAMLAAIELEDGWLNKIIDLGSNKREQNAVMRVIGQNPAAWGKIPLKDIKLYFLNTPENLGADWKKNHPTIPPLLGTEKYDTSILTNYFRTMEEDLKASDDNKTLQDFLLQGK